MGMKNLEHNLLRPRGYVHKYMLGSKRGFGQSMDRTAQSVDPSIAQLSMDCLLIPWSAQTEGRKAWIQAIHGLNRTKRVFAVAVAPSRKGRGPGIGTEAESDMRVLGSRS